MKEWLLGLERREQYVVLGGAAVLALYLLWYLLIGPVFAAAAQSEKNVEKKSAILAEMRQSAAVLGSVRKPERPSTDGGRQSLVVIVGRSATTAGLQEQLKQNQPSGESSIRVRFEAAPFNTLVTWLGQLQKEYQLSIQSASFDRSSPEGTVDARITLERPGT